MKSELTIVILTFNSEKIITHCLENINFDKYEVIVVDNASSDKSVEVVKDKFPKTKILQLPKNIGYGPGNNVALQKVETEFALILNPDSIIFDEDIEIALSEIKKFSNVANAGPIVLRKYPFDAAELSLKVKMMNDDFLGIKDCYWERLGDNYSVRFVVGAALFLRMSLLREIGFFDEKIFMYYEDDELCKRVRDNGYRSMIVTGSKAFHIGGGSCQKSLSSLYKKSWHLAWSKFYWKKIQKGCLAAKRSAIKFAIVNLVEASVCMLLLRTEDCIKNVATAAGSFAFFIGLGAFKKNGESRG